MGLGNFLHKLGRGMAAARLQYHGYTPELLEKERVLLQELYDEKQAERERKARADARAEEAAARAEQRAEEERRQRAQTHVMSTAKALADVVSIDPRTGEFLTGLTPEQADFYGLKPEQVDPVLTTARRIYQTQRDEAEAKRRQEKQDKADAEAAAEATWLKRFNLQQAARQARKTTVSPKVLADPVYGRALKAVETAVRLDDEPITESEFNDRVYAEYERLKAKDAAKSGTPASGPPPALGYSLRKPTTLPRSITSPGQPVGRSIDLGGGLTVRVRPR